MLLHKTLETRRHGKRTSRQDTQKNPTLIPACHPQQKMIMQRHYYNTTHVVHKGSGTEIHDSMGIQEISSSFSKHKKQTTNPAISAPSVLVHAIIIIIMKEWENEPLPKTWNLSPRESEPKMKTKHLREKHASSDTFSTAGTHPQKHKETLTPLLPDSRNSSRRRFCFFPPAADGKEPTQK